MKSYASIDRIEGKYTVLELELLDIYESKKVSFRDKETKMVDYLTDVIITNVGDVEEGDILLVEHENGEISSIYQKDDEEKHRRIEEIKSIMQNK